MSDFGAAIRQQRKRLGLTQRELAKLAGCAHVLVVNVEQGRTGVSLGKLLELLKVLGLQLTLEPGTGSLVVSAQLKG